MSTFQERVAAAKLKRQQEAAEAREKAELEKKAEEEKLASSDGSGGTSSWLNNFDKKRVMLAERLAQRDREAEAEAQRKRAEGYSLDSVQGLRVMHDAADIKEGQHLILTLDDMDVLDADSEQRLISRKLVDEDKQRALDEFKRNEHKPVYNPYDDDAAMLSQYDEKQKQSFVLDSGGLDPAAQQRLKRLRESAAAEAQRLQDLDTAPQAMEIASDYLTVEEMRAFRKPSKKKKKKKKKSKRRKKSTSALLEGLQAMDVEEEEEEQGGKEKAQDVGQRDGAAVQEAKREQTKQRLLAKQQRYEIAVQNALKASKKRLTNYDQDEEEAELQKTLTATRKRKVRISKKNAAQQIAARAAARSATGIKQEPQGEVYTKPFAAAPVVQAARQPAAEADSQQSASKRARKEDEPDASIVVESRTSNAITMGEEGEVIESERTPMFSGGMASTLAALQMHGASNSKAAPRVAQQEGPKEHWNLDKLDEFGRLMTPKEAFKEQARAFHGKFPGAMKQEKRLRQFQREMKAKEKLTLQHTLKSTEKIERKQRQTGLAYVKLTLGGADMMEIQEQAKRDVLKEKASGKQKK